MQDEQKNTPDIDPSGLFNTYTTPPGDFRDTRIPIHPETIYSLEERKKIARNQEPTVLKVIRIVIDGCVRMAKISVWGIAVLGGLFVTALATNTIDKAISIINDNIGSHLVVSGEVKIAEETVQVPTEKTGGMTSSVLNTTTSNNIPDEAAEKRRAILEARKAARILEEQREDVEKTLQ